MEFDSLVYFLYFTYNHLHCELTEAIKGLLKQWGGLNKKKAGRLLQDRVWDGLLEHVSPTPDTMIKLPLVENRQLETV